MVATRDKKTDRFKKRLNIWDGTKWNEGWYDNRKRFRVFRPDYPRAFPGGYALRAWVVWWLHHGKVHPKGTDLHHRNSIIDDDRIENLEVIEHGKHARLHNRKPSTDIKLICKECKKNFIVKLHRIRGRQKNGQKFIKFCSQKCYHAHPRSGNHMNNISTGLKKAYREGRR